MTLLGTHYRIPIQYDAKCETKILHYLLIYPSNIIKSCFMLATVLGTGKILINKIQVNYI